MTGTGGDGIRAVERGGGLPSSRVRSWFPHAMQSRIWEKNTRWGFPRFVGYCWRSARSRACDVTEAPEEDHLLHPRSLLEYTRFLGRARQAEQESFYLVNYPPAWHHTPSDLEEEACEVEEQIKGWGSLISKGRPHDITVPRLPRPTAWR